MYHYLDKNACEQLRLVSAKSVLTDDCMKQLDVVYSLSKEYLNAYLGTITDCLNRQNATAEDVLSAIENYYNNLSSILRKLENSVQLIIPEVPEVQS